MKKTHGRNRKAKMPGVARGVDEFLTDLATKHDFSGAAALLKLSFPEM
jgi:hypothetical protein